MDMWNDLPWNVGGVYSNWRKKFPRNDECWQMSREPWPRLCWPTDRRAVHQSWDGEQIAPLFDPTTNPEIPQSANLLKVLSTYQNLATPWNQPNYPFTLINYRTEMVEATDNQSRIIKETNYLIQINILYFNFIKSPFYLKLYII